MRKTILKKKSHLGYWNCTVSMATSNTILNYDSIHQYTYTRQKKKKRIQYSLKNYNQLRTVVKIFIFERNFF